MTGENQINADYKYYTREEMRVFSEALFSSSLNQLFGVDLAFAFSFDISFLILLFPSAVIHLL